MEELIKLLSSGAGVLFAALLFAGAVEAAVEYLFGVPFDKFPKLTEYKWTLGYIAVAIGILGAFLLKLDVIVAITDLVAEGTLQSNWLTLSVSGVLMGRGAEFVHRFFSTWIPSKLGKG